MKKTLALIAAIALPLFTHAQTNQVPSSASNAFQTIFDWFTAVNPELDGVFTNTSAMLWSGIDSVQGANSTLQNEIGLSYQFGKSFPISLEAVTRNGGVAGVVISQGIGLDLSWNIRDMRFSAYADGVYYLADNEVPGNVPNPKFKDKIAGEVGLRVFKAMGKFTYGYVLIGAQFPTSRQVLGAGIGIRF